jgi:hypothetical protein
MAGLSDGFFSHREHRDHGEEGVEPQMGTDERRQRESFVEPPINENIRRCPSALL